MLSARSSGLTQLVRHAGGSLCARVELCPISKLELLGEAALPPAAHQSVDNASSHSLQHASLSPKNPAFCSIFTGRLTVVHTLSVHCSAMSERPDDDLLALAVDVARAAGALLLDRFQRPATGVERKSSATDMVSDADRDAERLIRGMIAEARPRDGLLGEEGANVAGDSGLLWVVDPLDGTTNYLYGLPIWSVSVACEDISGGLVGVVFDPCRDELFAAERGRGATLNGRPLRVSQGDDLSRALIGTGFAYEPETRARQARVLAELLSQVRDIRRGGSAAIDLAWVACGRLDGYYELGTRHWDRAAGMLLVAEAGGVATPLDDGGQGSEGALAAGSSLHPKLAQLVEAAFRRILAPSDQLH
jgi:myo-inositol-1(or 4)-monophosphatase